MPLFAWAAYVHKASIYQASDTLRMATATILPHLDKADRERLIDQLSEPLLQEAQRMSPPEPPTKDEYRAQMEWFGIKTELN